MNVSMSPFVITPENLVSRDGLGSPVPRQPSSLHTQAESGAILNAVAFRGLNVCLVKGEVLSRLARLDSHPNITPHTTWDATGGLRWHQEGSVDIR